MEFTLNKIGGNYKQIQVKQSVQWNYDILPLYTDIEIPFSMTELLCAGE